LYACRLHNELRMKRLKREGWKWRDGEKDLSEFWIIKSDEGQSNGGSDDNPKESDGVETCPTTDASTQMKKLKQDDQKLLKTD